MIMRDPRPLFLQTKKSSVENVDVNDNILKITAEINATNFVKLSEETKRQDDVEEIKDNMKVEMDVENEKQYGVHDENLIDEDRDLALNLPFLTVRNAYQLTVIQFFCLLLLCVSGLYPSPYLNVCFPLLLFLFLPFRTVILKYVFGSSIDLLDPLDIEEKRSA